MREVGVGARIFNHTRYRRRPFAERSALLRCSARLWSVVPMLLALAMALVVPVEAGAHGLTGAATGGTLRLGYPAVPTTLDPAKYGSSTYWQADLSYDSLIEDDPKGVLRPGLATAWHYVGSDHTKFDMTLRSGVKFSDGSTMDATDVMNSLNYFFKGSGSSTYAGFVVTVTGPLSIEITSPTPNPIMPEIFDQDIYGAGRIIGPKGLANPKELGTTTDGAGPYMLQPSNTVTGDHYTFVRNPYYWNKSAQHYKTVIVKSITNQNTMLQALQSGEIDAAKGDLTTAQAAKAAGLTVNAPIETWQGLMLLDRGGKLVPALADVRVRQAINYAVNREAITRAVVGQFGRPTDVPMTPAYDGWLGNRMYNYNPTKARHLLKEAGYGGGFTLPVGVTPYLGMDTFVEAMAGYLSKVGITLQLTDVPVDQYSANLAASKFPAVGSVLGIHSVFGECTGTICPNAGDNPFHSTDPQIADLMQQLALANGAKAVSIAKQIERRIRSLAWFAPVTLVPEYYFSRKSVNISMVSLKDPWADPVWFTPKSGTAG